MKYFLIIAVVAMVGFLTFEGVSDVQASGGAYGVDIVEHGGGCRKSSPPGQCCHAGKKPYHCH